METALQFPSVSSPRPHCQLQNKIAHGLARRMKSSTTYANFPKQFRFSHLGQNINQARSQPRWIVRGADLPPETSVEDKPDQSAEELIVDSYLDEKIQEKQAAIDSLKEQEKFMMVGEGDATCTRCGYNYKASMGDKEFPIPKGTSFMDLPDDYYCPLCNAPKSQFTSSAKEIAGFAVNQGYGLGTNSMTGGQKQALIYGALVLFFFLFLGGYFLD